MGRRLSPEEIYQRAQANGYVFAAHHEEDSQQAPTSYVDKTIKDQKSVLNRYETLVTRVQREPHDKKEPLLNDGMVHASPSKPSSLRPGLPTLDVAIMKDSFRFYALGTDGRLDDRMTADSLNSQAERFFAGFTRITGSIVTEQDRSHIYNWVRKPLLKDRHVVNKRKARHLFGNKEVIEFSRTFWTIDEDSFIHPRNKVQVPFLISVYCWTGARIGSFFPSEGKPDACLRYRDIQLVLLRVPSGGWKVIYNLSQRWVKNNRDPENIVYKCSTSQHEKLLHDDTQYLLAMALADSALYGIESLEDLWDMSIPDGENALPLRWKDEVLQLPVVRNATIAHGVANAPLPKRSFERIFKAVLKSSGYVGTATVHAIRRALSKKLDERYTEVQRSQHINQSDPRVYGQSYVANTSSADGRRRFNDEEPEHDHIDYFQGFSQFREKGLPRQLPAKEKARVYEDPQLLDLQKRVQSLQIGSASDLDIKHAINEARNYRARVMKKRLAQFQLDWVRQRRDWKIDTRGKECPEDNTKTDLESALSRIMPERRRLARLMLSDRSTTEQERKQCIADLRSLISHDSTTFSLPEEMPVNGKCPVTGCETVVISLPKRQQSMHIHTCRRQELARKLERMPSELNYCYECFDWFVEEDVQFDDEISFLYHLDDIHDLQRGPQMKKICPQGAGSKPLSRWVPDTTCQKRKRLDGTEKGLLSAKRRTFEVQIGTTEVRAPSKSPNRGDSDAFQIPPGITPSEACLIDTGLDNDCMPELTYSNSTPSSEEGNFRSIDDFPVDDPHPLAEPPEPLELFNKPSITQVSGHEAQLLEEEAPFSQYLRSPSPECFDSFSQQESILPTSLIGEPELDQGKAQMLADDALFSDFLRSPTPSFCPIGADHNKDSLRTNMPRQTIVPANICLSPDRDPHLADLATERVPDVTPKNTQTKRPRVTLHVRPTKTASKPKVSLRLNPPRRAPKPKSNHRGPKSRKRL
ncbi:MAG: hypothetical protein M1825_005809 [Sarcosagium campestre]|nr:MAG: hypothetical protein M1825_005809 [Sarcosagium campestre]